MGTQITSQVLNVQELFSNSYEVPEYQRRYVWGRVQVGQLIQDIYEAFQSNESEGEYFIGSTVVSKNTNGLFGIIDGQQRITTLYVILCCIRDYIIQHSGKQPKFLDKLVDDDDIDSEGNDIIRQRVILNYKDSRDILAQIAERRYEIGNNSPSTKSVENIQNAYQTIYDFLTENFYTTNENMNKFAIFIRDNVKLIRVEAQDINQALKIFETINSRGMSLNAMDLLKNLIFMNVKTTEFEIVSENWRLMNECLEESGELPLRFLSYFVSSYYTEKPIQEQNIYTRFLENEERVGYKKHAVVFSRRLLDNARAFRNYINGNNPDGTENRYLKNIKLLDSRKTRHIISLLSIKDKPNDIILEVARNLENFIFVNIITFANTRSLDVRYSEWAKELPKLNKREEITKYMSGRFVLYLKPLENRFAEQLSAPEFGKIHKTKLRYILGKLSQYINEGAYGKAGAEANLSTFVNPDMHIEHILPVSPSKFALDEFDISKEYGKYTQRLGNLTLIEKALNTHLGNRAYSQKRTIYRQSKILLTKSIAESTEVGKTAISKSVRKLKNFETWTSNDIDTRGQIMLDLSLNVWGLNELAQTSNEEV